MELTIVEIDLEQTTWFEMYLCISPSCQSFMFIKQLKIFESRNNNEKKNRSTKYPREKKLGPTKYPREKNFGHTKYPREKQNTLDKQIWIHDIPTRKNFGPTKYPRRDNGTIAPDPRAPCVV